MKVKLSPSEVLKSHFEKMKEVIPEVYERNEPVESKEQKLFDLMKRTLTIVEAVYFQNRETFNLSRAEEYARVIEDLKELGYSYEGNRELLEKAATATILGAKLPMEKAKGQVVKKDKDEDSKKAM